MAVDSYGPDLSAVPGEMRGSDLVESACGGYPLVLSGGAAIPGIPRPRRARA